MRLTAHFYTTRRLTRTVQGDGRVGIANLPPGNATIEVLLAKTGQPITQIPIMVRKGFISSIVLQF